MKTAKKLFESRMEFLMAANDRDTADKDSVYIDYIFKLEQELHDNELRRKDLLTSLQRANAQKAELEQEKAELLEFVRDIAYNDISRNDITLDWVQKASWELLNKYTDEPDAL